MAARRKCSECDEWLPEDAPKIQKTHNAACRAKRSRRLKRTRAEAAEKGRNGKTPGQQALTAANRAVEDELREVVREELRPVVREAITEDVLRSVKNLVDLTPLMLSAIEMDLRSEEADIRQRAYTLLAKYTLGNPSVAPKGADAAPAPMQVVFQMPRPGDATPGSEVVHATAVEVKACAECSTPTPEDQFVAGSERCQACHDQLQAKVRERFE